MKLNETIELNGKEYTVELNRESAIRIEQYSNMQELAEILQKEIFEDKSKKEIADDEDPFAEKLDEEELIKANLQKSEALKKLYTRAFWIWLYPVEKLSIKEIEEILKPYLEAKEEKNAEYLGKLYTDLMNKTVQVREDYIKEQKNLQALTK